MNKYVILILLIGVGATVFLISKIAPINILADKSKTQQEEQKQEERGEYVIDPSDIYTTEYLKDDTAVGVLTEQEKDWLIHMREEEKLARDVYATLGDMWGMQIFSNITRSEQAHTDSVKTLLERYGLEDPLNNDTVGVFTLPEMQTLYDNLVEQGKQSLAEALVVGATIEDLDIFDLDTAMSETVKTDIDTVYANLQKGSRNHMRAFIKNLERQGGTYSPQYISEIEYHNIISSQQEQGRIQ